MERYASSVPGRYSARAAAPRSRERAGFPVLDLVIILAVAGIFTFLLIDLLRDKPANTMPVAATQTTDPANPTDPSAITDPADPTDPVIPTDPADPTANTRRYFERSLTGEDAAIYAALKEGLAERSDTVELRCRKDPDLLFDIYTLVLYDYPEYFWADRSANTSWLQTADGYSVTVTLGYWMTEAEAEAARTEVETLTADVITSLTDADDYTKVLGVYTYLIDNTAYDLSYHGKTLYELFTEGRAVCHGYATAAQYLLNRLGIECIYVSGDAGKADDPSGWEAHGWNIVLVDGEYYELDVTWGDPTMDSGEQELSYDYMCLTDADMADSHRAERDDLPECTATEANYYVREGLYLTSYDEDILQQWVRSSLEAGESMSFRVSSRSLYDEVLALVSSPDIYDMIPTEYSVHNISYSYDDSLYTLQLDFEY